MKDNPNIRHAIVSTDISIFSYCENTLYVALIKVKNQEYLGQLAFPGALILPEETAKQSVVRVVESKLGLNKNNIYLEELGAYSEVDRDVRGRVVSIAYFGLADYAWLSQNVSDTFELVPVQKVKRLAYDHSHILRDAVERLKEKFSNSTISQKLLQQEFTMSDLYSLFTTVLEKEIDKRNFVKKIKSLNIIKQSGGVVKGQKHRPAKLFEFRDNKVKQLEIF